MSYFPKVLVSRREMVRGLRGVSAIALVAIGLMSGLVADGAEAQASFRVGQGSASLGMRVQAVVGYRLMLRELSAPRVVAQHGDHVEYELEMVAASNAAWRLSIAAPSIAGPARERVFEVRDANGAWVALDAASSLVLLDAQDPCNPRPVVIRYRVRRAASESSNALPRVSISVAAS